MTGLLFCLMLAAYSETPAETPGGQAFRLGSGEYRWIPFTVKATPSEVGVHFEVLNGEPTVHAELLSMSDFRQFNRGRAHGALTATQNAQLAQFRKVITAAGQYAVVIVNEKKAKPATVSLELRVDASLRANGATELPPSKRLLVILASFLFFVVTVSWAGRKLLQAMRAA